MPKRRGRSKALGAAFVILALLALCLAAYDLGHGAAQEVWGLGMDATFLRCVYLVHRDTPKLRMR